MISQNATKKLLVILLHIVFWLLLFSLPFLLRPNQQHEVAPVSDEVARSFLYHYLTNWASWIGLYYFNSLVLIPYFIKRKKYLRYILTLLPVLVVLCLFNLLTFKVFLPHAPHSFKGLIAFYFLPSLFILSLSTAVTMFQNKLRTDKLDQQRENEHLKTELAFLRSQISPHFIFNILNNMVALARKKSELLEPSLFKLSSLLRYMLYETDEEKVLLEREVEYLQSYIDLQLQRFGSKVTVNATFEVLDNGLLLEPMLLIPFVENAFKHGTGLKQKGEINVELKAINKQIEFKVTNLYDPSKQLIKDKTSGIGLQNVRRRLDLLYKNQHTLLIDKKETIFSVLLKINLQK